MNLNISYELKLEVINAVKKRNQMFGNWIDSCSVIAFLLVSIIALINTTTLKQIIFGDNQTAADLITIFTVIVSICFDFILKSDKYKENLFIVNEILKASQTPVEFDKVFSQNINIITEIDVARARYDTCIKLKAHNLLSSQINEDKLQPVDLLTIVRKQNIIIAMILEIVLLILLFALSYLFPILLYIILPTMLIAGLIFMIIDIGSLKRAEKKVIKLYS